MAPFTETPVDSEDSSVLAELQNLYSTLPVHNRLGSRECAVIYKQGHTLYQRGRYAQAAEIFCLLTLYRPQEVRFLLAGAICLKLQYRFDMAAPLFFAAMMLDETDPTPALHLAQCLLVLQREDMARETLHLVLGRTKNLPEHAEIETRARQWLAQQGEQHG